MAQYVEDIPLKPLTACGKYLAQVLGTAADQTCDVPGGANVRAIGILQETLTSADVTAGRVCDVRVHGRSTCIASAAISRGALVVVAGASGKVVTATAAAKQWVVGIALTAAGADGDYLEVELTLGNMVDNS